MYIARILYPVKVLGPGKRIGIWFDGCIHHCPGCSNPELWEFRDRYKTGTGTLERLLDRVLASGPVEGFTLTGGDPFCQPQALEAVLDLIRPVSGDILVYTGFTYEYLQTHYPHILKKIGVLIDGPYIREQNNGSLLRGSDNQRILVLDPALKDRYGRYLAQAQNEIQNFTTVDGVISVGIHREGYETQIDSILRQKGLKNQ